MIFTIRPLRVQIMASDKPIEDFINHQLTDLGNNSYKRNIYFTRYIGVEKNEIDYINKIKEIDRFFEQVNHYLRIESLNYCISPKESTCYLSIYEAWLLARQGNIKDLFELKFPIRLEDDRLELTQKYAFGQVMGIYERYVAHASESMVRSFGVKLLGWISYYVPQLYQNTNSVCPKVIYIGSIKRQELLFLYFLSLMGCDVLYMNSNGDIKEAYPECEQFSNLYEEAHHQEIKVSAFIKQKKAAPLVVSNIEENNEPASVGQKEALDQKEVMKYRENKSAQRGSIHLQRPNTSNDRNNKSLIGASNVGVTLSVPMISGQQKKADRDTRVRPIGGLNHPKVDSVSYKELSYEEIARLSTSVVMITVIDGSGEAYKSGSGVVIHEDGYILTNFHVVEGGKCFAVRFENEDQVYETNRMIKYHTDFDLALIKVEKYCKPIRVYGERNLVRGQKVVAIGSPHGLFNSISDGIIAAFRQIREQDMIQFTAPISPGSSGGALLDMYGRLIGIITGHFDGQNLNLAVNNQMIEYFVANYISK